MQTELTAQDLKLVKEVFEKTGILTVKDKATFPGSTAPPYGIRFHPIVDERAGARAQDLQHERTVIRECIGSTLYPEGIPVGGVTVFGRNSYLDFPDGDKDFKPLDFRRDICTDEFKRLNAFANGRKWLTREDRERAEKEAIERSQGLRTSQQDPVGTIAEKLAEALSLLQRNGIAVPPAAPPAPAAKKEAVAAKP